MQKYKASPKSKAKSKPMVAAMPKPKAKPTAMAKAKPTAQSVAKQRAEMLKKLSPAMREMKMGTGCMPKMADGTKKVKAPSMLSKKASTATAPKIKVDATKTMDMFKLDSLNNAEEKRYKRRGLIDKLHNLAVKNRVLTMEDRYKIKSGQLDLQKNAEINERRKEEYRDKQDAQLDAERNTVVNRMENKAKRTKAVLEKAVSSKMKSGTKKVKC